MVDSPGLNIINNAFVVLYLSNDGFFSSCEAINLKFICSNGRSEKDGRAGGSSLLWVSKHGNLGFEYSIVLLQRASL